MKEQENKKADAQKQKMPESMTLITKQEKRLTQLWNEVRLLEKKIQKMEQRKELEAVTVMLSTELLERVYTFLIDCNRATGDKMSFSEYVENSLFLCLEAEESQWQREQEEAMKQETGK